ncbi:MAG: hypothetical protein WD972_03085 [Candidatus Andersenbacteria bacterium]
MQPVETSNGQASKPLAKKELSMWEKFAITRQSDTGRKFLYFSCGSVLLLVLAFFGGATSGPEKHWVWQTVALIAAIVALTIIVAMQFVEHDKIK